MQLDFFPKDKTTRREVSLKNASLVPGLHLQYDYLTDQEEAELLSKINAMPWLEELSRRVQHYGYKYDYRAKKIDASYFLGDLPTWLKELREKLRADKVIHFEPDQAIINEYLPGQGIAPHIDCEPCFGDCIVSISLGSPCVMNFEKQAHAKDKIEVFLEPKSLIVMNGESRRHWYHSIPARKKDLFNGETFIRQKRVSITFRKVSL